MQGDPSDPKGPAVKIAYIGNYRHSFCTEVHLTATLEDLGHELIRLQEDEQTADTIRRRAAGADLLVYQRTWGLPNQPEIIDLWRELEHAGTVTASYHLDLYLGLLREETLKNDPFWDTSYVFTPDGDPASHEAFLRRGINHHYVKPGVFRPECVPGRPRQKFKQDVVFVGSYPYPHREWTYRNDLVEWLYSTYGRRFRQYGGAQGVIRGLDLNSLYASATVVVGDSLCPGFTKPGYWSDRPYETVGRGGFLIMPFVRGLEDDFTDGEHLRFYSFGAFDELKDLIDHYTAHPAEARQIANAGQDHVRANLTYHDRLTEALKIMDLA